MWVPRLANATPNFPKLLRRVAGVALGLRLLKPESTDRGRVATGRIEKEVLL